jgi:hypothetical protein
MIAYALGAMIGYSIPRLAHLWGLDSKIASGPRVSAPAAISA